MIFLCNSNRQKNLRIELQNLGCSAFPKYTSCRAERLTQLDIKLMYIISFISHVNDDRHKSVISEQSLKA